LSNLLYNRTSNEFNFKFSNIFITPSQISFFNNHMKLENGTRDDNGIIKE